MAYVAPALRKDGRHVVLKAGFIEDESRHEGDALEFWNGSGAVQRLDGDPDSGALLLERIYPGAALEDFADREAAIGIACRLLRRLWKPIGPDHPFDLVADLATEWSKYLPGEAAELCRELAASQEDATVVNRDFHLGNILASDREPWLVIDPKPLVGEPAFDTGHLLRSLLTRDFTPHEIESLLQRLSSGLDLPPRRIAAWSFVRSVENEIWASETSLEDPNRDRRCAEILSTWL
ncbi:MAG: aminoglycoside phosphotransferase family protein [Acidobacteriota bacterium]|nr:aminoglycoside phosphotransferase family protein [Acidobacteriota bacterium]